jgi:RimJ/RimL family protein N-acetyltransferase
MPKRPFAPIRTERTSLRLLEERDLPLTLAWRNQDHIRRWFFHSDLIASSDHLAWFHRYLERDDDFVFIVEEVGEPYRRIGQAALYRVDWTAGRAEFGRLLIGERHAAGKGLAREITQALVDVATDRLGLTEIYLEVLAANTRAIRAYLACGFQATHDDGAVLRMSRVVGRAVEQGTGSRIAKGTSGLRPSVATNEPEW